MRRVEGRALDTDPSIELMKRVAADFGGRIVLISLFVVAAAAVVILVFDRRQLRGARRHSAETRQSFLLIKEKQMFVMVAAE